MAQEKQNTILVIDDDPDIILFLQFLLEDAGYTVVTATTGTILGQLQEETLPDLILLDLLLSGEDGCILTQQLKGQAMTAHIPVILYSAHPGAEREAKVAGADAFLAKPFGIDDILAIIARLLDHS
jgi:CheY-like chemotaxis protein